MIGIVDESTPFMPNGQIAYALALIVVESQVAARLGSGLPVVLNRTRPFHWAKEGKVIRNNLIFQMTSTDLRIHVCAALTTSANQATARDILLSQRLLPSAVHDGVEKLVIEHRSHTQDGAERAFVRDWFRSSKHRMPEIEHVAKDNPLTWLADAASGIWSDALIGRGEGSLEKLANSMRLAHAWWQHA